MLQVRGRQASTARSGSLDILESSRGEALRTDGLQTPAKQHQPSFLLRGRGGSFGVADGTQQHDGAGGVTAHASARLAHDIAGDACLQQGQEREQDTSQRGGSTSPFRSNAGVCCYSASPSSVSGCGDSTAMSSTTLNAGSELRGGSQWRGAAMSRSSTPSAEAATAAAHAVMPATTRSRAFYASTGKELLPDGNLLQRGWSTHGLVARAAVQGSGGTAVGADGVDRVALSGSGSSNGRASSARWRHLSPFSGAHSYLNGMTATAASAVPHWAPNTNGLTADRQILKSTGFTAQDCNSERAPGHLARAQLPPPDRIDPVTRPLSSSIVLSSRAATAAAASLASGHGPVVETADASPVALAGARQHASHDTLHAVDSPSWKWPPHAACDRTGSSNSGGTGGCVCSGSEDTSGVRDLLDRPIGLNSSRGSNDSMDRASSVGSCSSSVARLVAAAENRGIRCSGGTSGPGPMYSGGLATPTPLHESSEQRLRPVSSGSSKPATPPLSIGAAGLPGSECARLSAAPTPCCTPRGLPPKAPQDTTASGHVGDPGIISKAAGSAVLPSEPRSSMVVAYSTMQAVEGQSSGEMQAAHEPTHPSESASALLLPMDVPSVDVLVSSRESAVSRSRSQYSGSADGAPLRHTTSADRSTPPPSASPPAASAPRRSRCSPHRAGSKQSTQRRRSSTASSASRGSIAGTDEPAPPTQRLSSASSFSSAAFITNAFPGLTVTVAAATASGVAGTSRSGASTSSGVLPISLGSPVAGPVQSLRHSLREPFDRGSSSGRPVLEPVSPGALSRSLPPPLSPYLNDSHRPDHQKHRSNGGVLDPVAPAGAHAAGSQPHPPDSPSWPSSPASSLPHGQPRPPHLAPLPQARASPSASSAQRKPAAGGSTPASAGERPSSAAPGASQLALVTAAPVGAASRVVTSLRDHHSGTKPHPSAVPGLTVGALPVAPMFGSRSAAGPAHAPLLHHRDGGLLMVGGAALLQPLGGPTATAPAMQGGGLAGASACRFPSTGRRRGGGGGRQVSPAPLFRTQQLPAGSGHGAGGAGDGDGSKTIRDPSEEMRKTQERLEAYKAAQRERARAVEAEEEARRQRHAEERQRLAAQKERRRVEVYALNAILARSEAARTSLLVAAMAAEEAEVQQQTLGPEAFGTGSKAPGVAVASAHAPSRDRGSKAAGADGDSGAGNGSDGSSTASESDSGEGEEAAMHAPTSKARRGKAPLQGAGLLHHGV